MPSAARTRLVALAPWAIATALIGIRFFHLHGPLDDPHSWRQCDTAHYSLDFHRHGIDFLHPSVCWLGAHRTLILEFPLPEALSALLYDAFGADPIWDRIVALAFFLVATAYLYRIVRRIATARVAWIATLAWLAFPLGQFYSRAAHVDFAATAFAHGMLHHGMVAMTARSAPHATLAAACGAMTALIKAPYVLPVIGPLGLAALAGSATPLAAILAVTAVAFWVWRRHADAVNAAAPDWSFLTGYYKESEALWWYFGKAAQRLDPQAWVALARRFGLEILTPLGAFVAAAAPWSKARGETPGSDPRVFALAWLGCSVLYLLLFFPLHVIHNYYQIPFLAPAALLVGLGIDRLWLPRLGRLRAPLGAILLAALLAAAIWLPIRLGYYRVDWLRVEAGREVAARVPSGDLVIASDPGSIHSDPRLLFRADRAGWPVPIADLVPGRIDRLRGLGASWVAVVTSPDRPSASAPEFLAKARIARVRVAHQGEVLGQLELFDLKLLGPVPSLP